MRFAIALSLAFLVSLNLSAQKTKRPNYKLLWKISGNGLTKPSYLFGTMHVADKRAFDLNDSVIAKVIQCDAFAMEVHPDSITRFMASLILDQAKYHGNLESKMTPKEFKYYDSLLQKKVGVSLVRFKSVKEIKYFLQQRGAKKDKNTFLDAWLYNAARDNGKIMTGLEPITAQLDILEDSDSTELAQFKQFLTSDQDPGLIDVPMSNLFDIYFEGDIDKIYNFAKSITPEPSFKKMIIDRNLNMVDNIVSEIHKHTLFMAVGAAHLGGDPGIVNLLRKKGYTVTAVSAPFNDTASKYKSKVGSTAQWFTYSSSDAGFSVEMPQKPLAFEQAGLKSQMYFDIGTLTIYLASQIPLGAVVENQAATKMLDRMVSNMSNSQKVSDVKKITIDGYEGRELETIANGHTFKVRITIRRTSGYMMMVGTSKESINSPDAKRFMSSFKVVKQATPGIENLVSKEGSFSVDIPGKVTKQDTNPVDPSINKAFNIHVFYSTDNSTGSSYIVRYNDFPVGYVSNSDSTYIHGSLQAVYNRMKGVDISEELIDFNGYQATHFALYNPDKSARVDGIVVLRGERFYLLMNTGPNNGDTERSGKAFFDSFRFLPFEKPTLKEVKFEEGFSLKVPSTFEADSAVEVMDKETNKYSFVDRHSGAMYLIVTELFSKYDEVESVEIFFSKLKGEYFDEKNVFTKDSSIVDKLPTHEYIYQPKDDNSIVKIRSVIAGPAIIALWAYLPAHEDDTEIPDQIFNSFKVTAKSDWSLFADKADLILDDLSSADSTERAKANLGLRSHEFKKADLPKIYKAFGKIYKDDGRYISTKSALLTALTETHDNTTQAFIEEIYPTLSSDSTGLDEDAIGVLISMKTRESVRKGVDLLTNDKSGHTFSTYMLYDLLDSLELTNDVAMDLLNAYDKFNTRNILYTVMSRAIDSSVFTPQRKSEVIAKITEIATKVADTTPLVDQDDYPLINEKVSVLDALYESIPFTPEIETITRKFLTDRSLDVKSLAVQILIKYNKAVPEQDINLLAANREKRMSIYEELAKANKLQLMDKKYKTEKMLAEGDLYLTLNDEEDVFPEKVNFVKEKTVIDNGVKKKILVFTYGYEGSDNLYEAIAGPYDIKAKEFKRGRATSSTFEEYTSEKELNEHLAAFLADFDIKLN